MKAAAAAQHHLNNPDELRRIIPHHVEVTAWRDDQAECICPGSHSHGPT